MSRRPVEAGWLDVRQLAVLGTRVSPDLFCSANTCPRPSSMTKGMKNCLQNQGTDAIDCDLHEGQVHATHLRQSLSPFCPCTPWLRHPSASHSCPPTTSVFTAHVNGKLHQRVGDLDKFISNWIGRARPKRYPQLSYQFGQATSHSAPLITTNVRAVNQ